LSKVAFHSSEEVTFFQKTCPFISPADYLVHDHPTISCNVSDCDIIQGPNIIVKTSPADIVNVHIEINGYGLANDEDFDDSLIEYVDERVPILPLKNGTQRFGVWWFKKVRTGGNRRRRRFGRWRGGWLIAFGIVGDDGRLWRGIAGRHDGRSRRRLSAGGFESLLFKLCLQGSTDRFVRKDIEVYGGSSRGVGTG